MSNEMDKFISEDSYDLEDILKEFGSAPSVPEVPSPVSQVPEETPEEVSEEASEEPGEESVPAPPALDLPWPEAPRREHKLVQFPSQEAEPDEEEDEEPEEEPEEDDEDKDVKPYVPRTSRSEEEPKVLTFPGAPAEEEPEEETAPSTLEDKLEQLRKKADDFAQQMFSEEGVEVSEQTRRIERLIPAVDEEETPPPPPEKPPRRERKPRPAPEPLPDRSPGELYQTYSKGLKTLRLRWLFCVLLSLVQFALLALPHLPVALPAPMDTLTAQIYLSAGLLALSALLSADLWGKGLWNLCRGKPGMDTLLGFTLLATLTDAVTMTQLAPRENYLPYCAVTAAALSFGLRGSYLKRRALRLNCRTAATAQEPYLVTLDEKKWNGKPTYTKHPGPIHGFGSQIQEEDGAQRMYRLAAPVLLLGCVVLSVLASVGKQRPEYLPWCLSATLNAAAGFGSLLAYAKPYHILTRRLTSVGAALAGWEGVREGGHGILLTDTDLFPPGTVSVNGIKVFGDFPIEKVVAVTASVIRESGSGLDRLFHDLLRAKGAIYRRCEKFTRYEGGGSAAVIRSQEILVGSAAFMSLMNVTLPQGLNVKNAVFCAIDGELAGIFALNYALHPTISPALSALIQNRVFPVLATRDFNLIPTMLRQRFKLPVEKMEFPPVERRVELSDIDQEHSSVLTAVLCREGLGPFSDAVVGSRRLRRTTVLNCVLTCLGSVSGVLLTFYLTVGLSFFALSPVNLLIFQFMWLVPVYLISGWVNQY